LKDEEKGTGMSEEKEHTAPKMCNVRHPEKTYRCELDEGHSGLHGCNMIGSGQHWWRRSEEEAEVDSDVSTAGEYVEKFASMAEAELREQRAWELFLSACSGDQDYLTLAEFEEMSKRAFEAVAIFDKVAKERRDAES